MITQIAQLIYENQYGTCREEAIEYIGFSEDQYPTWGMLLDKNKYILWAESILLYLSKNKKKDDKTLEKLAKYIYELMNPKSELMWNVNDPEDRVVFTGSVFADYSLAEHERDDYRNLAHLILNHDYKPFQLN